MDVPFASRAARVLRAVAAAELAQLARDLGLDVERLAPPAHAALVARDDERAHLGFEAGVRGRPVELAQLRLDVDRLEAAAAAALVARLEQLANLLVALPRGRGAGPYRLVRRPVAAVAQESPPRPIWS